MKLNSNSIKIAVMTDAHGNLLALKQVINDIEIEGCTNIYHLGDSIAIGPYPKETLDLLLQNNVVMLMGNHEHYYVSDEDKLKTFIPEHELKHQLWVKSELGTKYIDVIKDLPYILKEKFNGMEVLLQHYPLDSNIRDNNSFKPICKDQSPNNLTDLFKDSTEKLVFYGHHHPYHDCIVNVSGRRFINPGSLGCSHDNFARYCIAEFFSEGYNITFKKVEYNKQSIVNDMKNSNIPEKEFICKVFYGIE
ncbi:MAG: metallophosphatase family protein [Vallitalea sp.]|nr:metallophosphatase family protein [Vallitalea sp.]